MSGGRVAGWAAVDTGADVAPSELQAAHARWVVGNRGRSEGGAAASNVAAQALPSEAARSKSVGDDGAFAVDAALNSKVHLVTGPGKLYADLRVGALVNPTNERLDEWSGLSAALLARAGAALQEECAFVPSRCQTGEVKVTRGCNLPAAFVLHTVGPKWTAQYAGAAATALHHCYKGCLAAAKEQGVRSIALPTIYHESKGYPRQEAAHVAVRCVFWLVGWWSGGLGSGEPWRLPVWPLGR